MYQVHLKNIRLFGFHGVYAEENALGGMFELNITCSFQNKGVVTALEETVNYESVYFLVKEKFAAPTALLETLTAELAAAIYSAYPFLQEISVTIMKLNPPIKNFSGQTGVTFTAQYT